MSNDALGLDELVKQLDESGARFAFAPGAIDSLIDKMTEEANAEIEKTLLGNRLIEGAPISFASADIMKRVHEDSMRAVRRTRR